MSERKGINRYYPPDVDPSKVKFSTKTAKTVKNGRPKAESIRVMAPFSMKCLNCKEYIAKSRKFNARKETTDRDYLGIKIFKLSLRCPRCYGELILETDPKNGDYTCVSGCKKNYERSAAIKENESIDEMIVRLEKEVKEDERMKELERKGGKRNGPTGEETGMEQLEKRLIEQQKEKERSEALEELQERMENFEERREILDLHSPAQIAKSEDGDQGVVNEEEDNNLKKKLDVEARNAFENFKRMKNKSYADTEISGYSSSSADEAEVETNSNKNRINFTNVGDLKRPNPERLKGIIKRKRTKIIS